MQHCSQFISTDGNIDIIEKEVVCVKDKDFIYTELCKKKHVQGERRRQIIVYGIM